MAFVFFIMELIKITKQELFKGMSSLGVIPDEFMIKYNYNIQDEYDELKCIEIISTLSFVKCLDHFCEKNNIKNSVYEFIYYNNEPYVKLNNIGVNKLYISFFLSCYAGSNIIKLKDCIYIPIHIIDFLDYTINIKINKKVSANRKTYIMFDEVTGYYKIGFSNNIVFREKTLMASIPLIKTVLFTEENKEKELHRYFSEKRIRGEWFNLNADDILYIIENHGFKKYKL